MATLRDGHRGSRWSLGLALVLVLNVHGRMQTPAGKSEDLAGTSWQLVRIQYMDDKTVSPDDRSKYTLAFAEDGRLSARIDCNRGSGTWKSAAPGQLLIGPLATTRAMCPPGSLYDRVVKDLQYVRTYVIKDGHLYLSLMADGGIYELEPLPGKKAPAPAPAERESAGD